MPITFTVAEGVAPANVFQTDPIPGRPTRATLRKEWSPEEVLAEIWDGGSCKEFLQTSLKPGPDFIPNESGFVHGVIRAYNDHHNLIIRPDDIWTAILAQFNLYVIAHAQELRSKFVAHEGKKKLKIIVGGTRYTVDYGKIAQWFGDLLRENIIDPALQDWILPDFSTSTDKDTVVCSIMMMSTLQEYFIYEIHLRCGIPKITLLGERNDYESILQRLDKLEEFGPEPTAFARLLRPVLQQFILAFDAVDKGETPDYDFWGRTCHYLPSGSGPTCISGWIATFCVWNKEGHWQGPAISTMDQPLTAEESSRSRWGPPPPMVMDGLRYPVIDINKIPRGYVDVEVLLVEGPLVTPCQMVAGHVGATVSGENTLQPASEWFMFVKGDQEPRPPQRKMIRWK